SGRACMASLDGEYDRKAARSASARRQRVHGQGRVQTMDVSDVVWVLERDVFTASSSDMRRSLADCAIHSIDWDDQWWSTSDWPALERVPVVFRGSLENAARVSKEIGWRPGSYCDVEAFEC